LFYDFYTLAELDSNRRGLLYLLGADKALKFLRGNRALDSVLSKNRKIGDDFAVRYGERFRVVSEYYKARRDRVELVDLEKLLPEIWRAWV
jgi:hypothetical protein